MPHKSSVYWAYRFYTSHKLQIRLFSFFCITAILAQSWCKMLWCCRYYLLKFLLQYKPSFSGWAWLCELCTGNIPWRFLWPMFSVLFYCLKSEFRLATAFKSHLLRMNEQSHSKDMLPVQRASVAESPVWWKWKVLTDPARNSVRVARN